MYNKIKRMTISLRKNYFTRKVQALHSADFRSWSQKTKQFLHSKHTNPLQNLKQEDSTHTLAEEINDFFHFGIFSPTAV